MKKSIFLIALSLMLLAGTNNTNAQSDNNREARRAEMQGRQTERLVKELKLSDEQKEKFEPIYKNYLTELAALRQERTREDQQGKEKDLTDEEANARLQEIFTRQEEQIQQSRQRLDIQKKYCAEFSAVLTPQQILKLFKAQQNRNRGFQQGGRGQGGRGQGGPRGGFGGGGFGGESRGDF